MKVNKRNPKHWFILIIFSVCAAIGIIYRKLTKPNNIVLLYGHKLNGNLKALYDKSLNTEQDLYFLTIDPDYYQHLKAQNINVLFGLSLLDMLKASKSPLLISDHGLHSLFLFLKFTDMKFVDVWHGIPFKGFNGKDFKVQHQYNETWVASPFLKQLYTNKFGFQPEKVKALGYARTDVLVKRDKNINNIKKSIGLKNEQLHKKVILFAPTWVQDNASRNIYPFNKNEEFFINLLEKVCQETNSICLLRKHLNTPLNKKVQSDTIFECPSAIHPDTESILLISDILVCDWSSIAFDYLLLNRPTLFLNVPAPFKKGLSLDEDYRFGEIIQDTKTLSQKLIQYLNRPKSYHEKYAEKQQVISNKIYLECADGKATQRGLERIKQILSS